MSIGYIGIQIKFCYIPSPAYSVETPYKEYNKS